MAEGATEDARQALTLVAVNQNAIVTPTLPSLQKRFFVLMLSNVSDAGAPGANIGVVFAITGPDDKVLLVQHATAALPEPASSAIPETGGQMIFQAGLGIEEYGAYVARCTLTLPNGAKLETGR